MSIAKSWPLSQGQKRLEKIGNDIIFFVVLWKWYGVVIIFFYIYKFNYLVNRYQKTKFYIRSKTIGNGITGCRENNEQEVSGKCTGSERVAVEADHGSGSSNEVLKSLHFGSTTRSSSKITRWLVMTTRWVDRMLILFSLMMILIYNFHPIILLLVFQLNI